VNENEEYSDPADGVELRDLLRHRAFQESTGIPILSGRWYACCVMEGRDDMESRGVNSNIFDAISSVKASKPRHLVPILRTGLSVCASVARLKVPEARQW
jgi:hypothetical protein